MKYSKMEFFLSTLFSHIHWNDDKVWNESSQEAVYYWQYEVGTKELL